MGTCGHAACGHPKLLAGLTEAVGGQAGPCERRPKSLGARCAWWLRVVCIEMGAGSGARLINARPANCGQGGTASNSTSNCWRVGIPDLPAPWHGGVHSALWRSRVALTAASSMPPGPATPTKALRTHLRHTQAAAVGEGASGAAAAIVTTKAGITHLERGHGSVAAYFIDGRGAGATGGAGSQS